MVAELEAVKGSILSKRNLIIICIVLAVGFFALMFIRKSSPYVAGLVSQTPLESAYTGLENLWSQGILTDPTKLSAFGTVSLGGIVSLVGVAVNVWKKGEDKVTAAEAERLKDVQAIQSQMASEYRTLQLEKEKIEEAKNGAISQINNIRGELSAATETVNSQGEKLKEFEGTIQSYKSRLNDSAKHVTKLSDETQKLSKTIENVKRSGADALQKLDTQRKTELNNQRLSYDKTITDLSTKNGSLEQRIKDLTQRLNRKQEIEKRAEAIAQTM